MHTTTKKIIIVLLLVAAILTAAVGEFIRRAHAEHRSIPGHIVRWLKGEGGMEQDLNDMADDIRNTPSLSQLQSWSMETLRRFQDGTVQTNGHPRFYWDESSAVKLARQERPEFIKHQWGETNEDGEEEPEIFIVFNTNKQPDAVVIGWYSYGIRIGSPEYRMPYEPWAEAPYFEVKPGVYVYGNYK
jgi:hypothetical protein